MLTILILIFSVNTRADSQPSYTRVDNPCKPEEQWLYGKRVPAAFIDVLSSIKHSPDGAVEVLQQSSLLKPEMVRTPSAEDHALDQFATHRAYLDHGLVHLAYRGFASMLTLPATDELMGIRLAALGCMNHIHSRYPAIRLSKDVSGQLASTDIRKIWPDQRKQLWESMISILQRKFAESGLSAEINVEQNLLRSSGIYLEYIQVAEAILQKNEKNMIYYSDKLVKMENLPKTIEPQKDALELNLARMFHNQKSYKQAVKMFDQVSHKSNLLTQALIGKAWAQLMDKNMSEAVGTAYTLIVGELRNSFEPDAPIIAAIAYFENCHYSEAMQSINFFRKKYAAAYRWLYDWKKQVDGNVSRANLYELLVNSLKTKNTKIPSKVLSEWTRSPVFIAWQDEINLVSDEVEIATKLVKEIRSASDQGKRNTNQVKRDEVRNKLLGFLQEVPSLQRTLVGSINGELNFLNRYMIQRWVGAYENSQLVEAEVFNATGEAFLTKNIADKKAAPVLQQVKKPTSDLPELDWGTYSVNNDQDAETWEDEVGFFQSDVSSLCKAKK